MASSLDILKEQVSDEVQAILAGDFGVSVTQTTSVPHSGDPAITFPNLDAKVLKTKLIETTVLYIDIRRSTELNLQHTPKLVSKLYSAFVRAMTRCAQQNGGHVRGIIGDRIMCIFDADNPFVNAVETAQSMHSVATYVINKHFKQNEVQCGIGIDYGRMLVTKTGFRRHGHEQQNYRNLVWLGRPANVASKLTDIANKAAEDRSEPIVHIAQSAEPTAGLDLAGLLGLGTQSNALAAAHSPLTLLGSAPGSPLAVSGLANALAAPSPGADWAWRDVELKEFFEGFVSDGAGKWSHKIPRLKSFYLTSRTVATKPKTPAILMTQAVFNGYKAAKPKADSITRRWYKPVSVRVPGYTGQVFGGDVIWTNFK